MLRHLAIAVLAFVGDLSYMRLWVALAAGVCVATLLYWFALPSVLPLWPAIVIVGFAAFAGLLWQRHSP